MQQFMRGQLEVARVVVDSNAEVAKAFWRLWGPWGRPAIDLVEVGARMQRQYLESLEGTLGGTKRVLNLPTHL